MAPTKRHIIGVGERLVGVMTLHDGSLLFFPYVLYSVTINQKGNKELQLLNAGSHNDNVSVPVSEHISRTLALNAIYSVINLLYHHLNKEALAFTFIIDSVCSSTFFNPVVNTTLKLASNTRTQKKLLLQLSSSFPYYWVLS